MGPGEAQTGRKRSLSLPKNAAPQIFELDGFDGAEAGAEMPLAAGEIELIRVEA
jgi:hypothetical protein